MKKIYCSKKRGSGFFNCHSAADDFLNKTVYAKSIRAFPLKKGKFRQYIYDLTFHWPRKVTA